MSYLSTWNQLLSADSLPEAVENHFSVLAETDDCRKILHEIAQRVLSISIDEEDHVLLIEFETADGDEKSMYCYPPCEEDLSSVPPSLAAILKVHNGLSYPDDGGWCSNLNGFSDGEFDTNFEQDYAEDDETLSDVEFVHVPIDNYSDWWVYHPTLKTPSGEPALGFFCHEGGEFEEPISTDFGTGGYFLRLIGNSILGDNDPRVAEYCS